MVVVTGEMHPQLWGVPELNPTAPTTKVERILTDAPMYKCRMTIPNRMPDKYLNRDTLRKCMMTMLLAAMSGGAAAEWVEVAGNEAAATYADSDTIRRRGTMVTMWHLVDYANAREVTGIGPYSSARMLTEYDCEQPRTRTLYVVVHSGNMGAGKVLGKVAEPGHWRPIPPDTPAEILRGYACWKE